MKYLKMLGLAAGATMALMAFAVGSASATTLEIGGTTQNKSIEITGSLSSGTSAIMGNTSGTTVKTCTGGSGAGSTTSPFTGTSVSGVEGAVEGASCSGSESTVHKKGTVKIEHISGSTNGTIISSGAEVTVPTTLGTVNCKSGEGVDVGVLTGKASGQATVHVNAVVNCGFLLPSATMKGSGVVTGPEGLGVSA